jgi:hypothetical protein
MSTTQGRRVPDVDFRTDDWSKGKPGDYMRVTNEVGGADTWYCVTPDGQLGSLRNHEVIEHEDGTITVSPSILVRGEREWHGYLEHGVWRSV